MCGIVGAVALRDASVAARHTIERMTDAIRHRGPDDDGFHFETKVALGMRRLSIIDVEGGQQPLRNESGTAWLVANGEIYNFRELRAKLLDKGYRFRTGSDCEVILHLYAEHGDSFVEHLNGMFGFALWDSKQQRLLLGRDRLGVKPLYYAVHDGCLVFASETKAILEAPGFTVAIDPVALDAYLTLGYVPAPRTLFQGISKLPPASVMIVDRRGVDIKGYWSLPPDVDRRRNEQDWAQSVRDSMERSVKAQMVSDVPIGAFLSGGIDSSAVVAFMAEHSDRPIRTYSIGFAGNGAEAYYNELPYARQVAARFDTEHHEILVTPDVVRLLPRLIWHADEPLADSALVTTYLVAELASQDVKVILSGVGGDELFGGYRRYLGAHYDRLYRKLPGWLRKHVLQSLATKLPSDRHSRLLDLSRLLRSYLLSADAPFDERYRGYVQVYSREAVADLLTEQPTTRYDTIGEAFRDSDSSDSLQQLMMVDLKTQLPDDLLLLTDKMTMATSLECRVPLLDHELVELAARIPAGHRIKNGQLKSMMKKALAPVLPREVLHRNKRGFGAPIGAWMKRQLAPAINTLLSRESIERRGLFRSSAVRDTVSAHETNQADHTDHLSALMNLEIWCRLFLDRESPADITEALSQGAASGNPVRVPSLSVSS